MKVYRPFNRPYRDRKLYSRIELRGKHSARNEIEKSEKRSEAKRIKMDQNCYIGDGI